MAANHACCRGWVVPLLLLYPDMEYTLSEVAGKLGLRGTAAVAAAVL
jgi:hypothetical protein